MDTINLADRLQKLRKENGYSQEQLADELNVSRQAISKWECGEAMPDTENLIALAKLYNCSLDEIVFETKPAADAVAPATEEDEDNDNDVQLTQKQKLVVGTISAVTLFASVIAYLLMGFLCNLWHPTWIVFFAIPIVPSTVDSIIKKDSHIFPLPVVVVVAYLLMGFLGNLWHPGWVVFLIVPVYYAIFDGIAKIKKNNK